MDCTAQQDGSTVDADIHRSVIFDAPGYSGGKGNA
jgi:hypothetical protein